MFCYQTAGPITGEAYERKGGRGGGGLVTSILHLTLKTGNV